MEAGVIVAAPTSKIIEYAERIIDVAVNLSGQADDPNKRGGYLAVWTVYLNNVPGGLRLLAPVGYSPEDKWRKRMEVAEEKCQRLDSGDGKGHLTSYESRNPKIGRWGGGVRGPQHIYAFSGLPELWDEAAMFVLAIRLHQLRADDVLALISEERNPHLRPLLEAAHWTE